ncbi:glycoside hydrolase family 3 protein [Ohessyouella blattaphilus]|uniref:Glycoside hydrolase family 3 C-terminal domain-containing protein n=1 Tax=Ohessyouella blattaphilus TaxID=2949333 RepID=A0ABT1EMA9_9FIRM|nr:glycoside hydrolase family 3 protein [Ohessyouella blattaphilus]MCP1110417.1 glycoside hydrolase family 3 C-terminal domain-containing protein [Ohessyouella blattaphilus]MCR8563811.1 glycoside hydrolase family 3 C-terminal domain-containing protein [Ohessyouella blattaphilus]
MEKVTRKPGKAGAIITSLLLVVLIVVNVVCGMYYNVITQFFSKAQVDEEATKAASATAREVAERIEEEGIVLLKNANQALPLNEKDTNVNVFGWASINPVYSGVGTGGGNEDNATSFLEGLENSGFAVNDKLVEFYENSDVSSTSKDSYGSFSTDYTKHQVPVSEYSEELLSDAQEFSDVALIMFSRIGGEGASDVPMDMSELGGAADEHYLELSQEEKDLIDMVDGLGFEKVVLVLNSSYPIEVSVLDEDKVDSAIWIGGPGEAGMNAVGRVLAGEVNPSGRLVNTYARDLMSSPAAMSFGDHYYTGTEYMTSDWYGNEYETHQSYVDYVEGIYVGYRYYETRYVDNETFTCDEEAYRQAVQYPFGYGLSYSEFKQEIDSFEADDEMIALSVKVTNTGDTAGKEVVQVYYTAPYIVGGIEKSHVVLAEFGKTDILEPGESELVEISFAVEEMASFDYEDQGCYVLDEGNYQIKLMKNAHEVIDSRDYKVASTIVYNEDNKRDSDNVAAVTHFEEAEGDVEITYVSRADWEGTMPKDVPMEREPQDGMMEKINDYSAPEVEETEDIVIADHGMKLEEMIGLDYDDPKWEQLLEQVSVEEMQKLIGYGGFATQVIKSIDKPYSIDLDGPAGLKALVNETAYEGVGYTTGVVVASTWNTELVQEMGECFSAEADAWKVNGIYGPSMNIQRIPFGGRNYEYYSEDSLISGKIAASLVTGFNTNDVYNYIKHFAMYNQCTNAAGIVVWSNEQAIREIYLRPFEICVKEADTHAVMSSYNRIGSDWSGASKALLTDVLRDEWGFEGMVISDWVLGDYMNAEQGIHAGNDLMLNTLGSTVDDTSNAGKQAMRKATHNILYTVVNSNAMEIAYYGPTLYWLYMLIGVDVAAVIGAIAFFIRRNKKMKAYKEANR